MKFELNIDGEKKIVTISNNILFNALLAENPSVIKKLIKVIYPFYKIRPAFFEIVNNYADFNNDGTSLYGGLIVRTNLYDYAVLYLEGTCLDEEYMIKIIDDYIKDMGNIVKEVNINKFEISKITFLLATSKL